jgi:hypothetical protein
VPPQPRTREAFVFIADGQPHSFPSAATERDAFEATLAAMGPTAIQCPAAETKTSQLAGTAVACRAVWVAEGCGRRTGFVVFHEDSTETERFPGALGEPVLAHVEGIVRMANDRASALDPIKKAYDRLGLPPSPGCFPWLVDEYFDLQARGARDLECPRAEVVPIQFSRGQMAEGCGKRASYWGDRLSCIVKIAP